MESRLAPDASGRSVVGAGDARPCREGVEEGGGICGLIDEPAEERDQSVLAVVCGDCSFDGLGVLFCVGEVEDHAISFQKNTAGLRGGPLVALLEAMVFADANQQSNAEGDEVALLFVVLEVLRASDGAFQ